MRKINLIYIFSVLIFLVSCNSEEKPQQPTAKTGILNLSTWNFSNDGVIDLDGEWEFLWSKLQNPNDIANDSFICNYIKVPSIWNNTVIDEKKLSNHGFATYKLLVIIPENSNLLSLKIRQIETAYKLWINDSLLCCCGLVDSTDNMTPAHCSDDFCFMPQTDSLNLTLQVSNFNSNIGGMSHSISLGLPVQIAKQDNLKIYRNIFIISILLVCLFYYMGLFLTEMTNLSTLFFAMACLLFAIQVSASEHRLIAELFPQLSLEWILKIRFIFGFLKIPFFAAFLYQMFKKHFSLSIIYVIAILGLLISLAILILPTTIFSNYSLPYYILVFAMVIYPIYCLLKASFKNKEGAIIPLFGTIVLVLTRANDVLFENDIIQTTLLSSYGIFIFITTYSLFFSLKFAKSFRAEKKFAKRLLSLDEIKIELVESTSYKLQRPLKIITKYLNAKKGILVLRQGGDWNIAAGAFIGNLPKKLPPKDFYDKSDNETKIIIPIDIIYHIIDNKKVINIDNALVDPLFESSKYIKANNVKSVFSIPLIKKDKLTGVIYLENSTQIGAFDEEKLHVLNMLSSQLSTIIDNVRIYNELDEFNKSLGKKVEERTTEVNKQKEKIEQAFNNVKLLSVIGKEITSSLSFEKISDTIHKHLNTMMDATLFGIGLYNESNEKLEFKNAKKRDIVLPDYHYDVDNTNTLSVVCFKEQLEILIGDFAIEFQKYLTELPSPKHNELPKSLIYLPLGTKDNCIGVISVQSFNEQSYTEFHLNILKNLATYITIALVNSNAFKQIENQKEEISKQANVLEDTNKELEKLSIVASKTDNAVMLMDAKGNFEWVNDGFCRMFGFSFDELVNYKSINIIGPRTSPNIKEKIQWCIANKKTIIYEYYAPRKNGEMIWVQTTLTPIIDENGNISRLVAIDSNIEKLKQAEGEILIQKEEIMSQRDEIEKQRDRANKQKKSLTDSILYARRIQRALLPQKKYIKKVLSDYFILYLPKDIVSGDFYWITPKDNKMYIAVADCTGHGVPGGFMSMLGLSYLNEIVNKYPYISANEILNELRSIIMRSLHQTGKFHESKDGMDMGICIIDFKNNTLQYSGAYNPLYIIRPTGTEVDMDEKDIKLTTADGYDLIQVKADKMPIGYHHKSIATFTNKKFELLEGDTLYMFSDGYLDQFGGSYGRKFLVSNFKKLLLGIQDKTLKEQKRILEKTFISWKSKYEQVDDVLVMGIKISFDNINFQTAKKHYWKGKTFLVAEDRESTRMVIEAALFDTEVEILWAENGEIAVELFTKKNKHIDLVLMDLIMPVMDGYEAITKFKEINSKIPIIVQTSVYSFEEKERAFTCGCDDYISKPIKEKELIATVKKYIE